MTVRTRVKICGLTREADIDQAVQAGADAIGFVCFAGSKRYVDPARAAELRRRVPAFVSVVALFVNPTPQAVRQVQQDVGPDLLQFHGDESPSECRRYGQRYLRAFRVGAPGLDSAASLAAACADYDDAAGWLFDSYSAGFGGSGQGFDHRLLADVLRDPRARPLVLAGGLHADNLGAALAQVRPWAVDVSSGVERAPGLKDAAKLAAFFDGIKKFDSDLHT